VGGPLIGDPIGNTARWNATLSVAPVVSGIGNAVARLIQPPFFAWPMRKAAQAFRHAASRHISPIQAELLAALVRSKTSAAAYWLTGHGCPGRADAVSAHRA
jgi:hypothetical protein